MKRFVGGTYTRERILVGRLAHSGSPSRQCPVTIATESAWAIDKPRNPATAARSRSSVGRLARGRGMDEIGFDAGRLDQAGRVG